MTIHKMEIARLKEIRLRCRPNFPFCDRGLDATEIQSYGRARTRQHGHQIGIDTISMEGHGCLSRRSLCRWSRKSIYTISQENVGLAKWLLLVPLPSEKKVARRTFEIRFVDTLPPTALKNSTSLSVSIRSLASTCERCIRRASASTANARWLLPPFTALTIASWTRKSRTSSVAPPRIPVAKK